MPEDIKSRIEAFLAAIAGATGVELPEPQSRIEEWLAYIAEHGGSGGGGISPTITVTDITGGHKLTITDVEGTKTVDILDGEDGHTPVKGTDYFTAADIAEIVQDVIDALPTYDGGVE